MSEKMTKKKFKEILDTYSAKKLVKLGFKGWDNTNPMLMLIPCKYYKYIPKGYKLYSIDNKESKFEHGKTDDDIRFGVLAYGVLKKVTLPFIVKTDIKSKK